MSLIHEGETTWTWKLWSDSKWLHVNISPPTLNSYFNISSLTFLFLMKIAPKLPLDFHRLSFIYQHYSFLKLNPLLNSSSIPGNCNFHCFCTFKPITWLGKLDLWAPVDSRKKVRYPNTKTYIRLWLVFWLYNGEDLFTLVVQPLLYHC